MNKRSYRILAFVRLDYTKNEFSAQVSQISSVEGITIIRCACGGLYGHYAPTPTPVLSLH